jgi:hypothetical protein
MSESKTPQNKENEMKLSITSYGQTPKTARWLLYDEDRMEDDGSCKVLGNYKTKKQAVYVERIVHLLPPEITDILPRMTE